MRKKFSVCLLTAMLLACLMSSCVTSKKVNLLQQPTKHNRIPEYVDTLSFEDYRLRTGDRLYVYVYSVDEQIMKLFNAGGTGHGAQMRQQMSQNSTNELYTYLVLDDGTIDFPQIGHVQVRDMTTREVKQVLETELSTLIKNYGVAKMISCEVNVVQRSYSVISQRGSGNFPISKEKLTIYEALAQAGDVGDWSDRSKVRIIREIEGQTRVLTFDIRSADIIHSEYYYIEPNDVIYVQKLRGQAFGVSNAATTVAIVASTLSFGGFIYALVVRVMNKVNETK
ncbi:MAG: polysaccharide biosynthesis/export family protein [Paludibacteraceae bacterium]|nr:polysaccharide biosynthesis/export family protein [Paludibacteraceae bacterium]